MALKTTVRMGGDVGATTVDYTSEIPLWELNEQGAHQSIFDTGMKCDNGNARQYQFTIINDLGDIPRDNLTKNLPAFTRVTITENAPGYEAALSYGRIARKDIDRGDRPWGNSRTFRVTVNDANFDLTDLDLVTPWVRPSESGRARVLALIAGHLSGNRRVTTNISNHLVAAGGEVTMPAHTYPAGTSLIEILNDCATVEGKFYNVAIHHQASASHLCFQYQDEDDHTNFLSTITITDNAPNLTTQFPPIWDQGSAALEDGDVDPISHLISRYGVSGDSYYVAANSSRVTSYDYRARSYNDSKSETAAQAAARAEAVLAAKGREHVSHQVTIKLRASQVDLLCAGMSINIRSAASMGGLYLGTTQLRRIAELTWEPIAPDVGAVPGFYYAHMQLDRAVRQLPEGKGAPVGPKAPTAPITSSPTFVEGYADAHEISPSYTFGLGVGGAGGDMFVLLGFEDPSESSGNAVAYTSVQWRPDGLVASSVNFTKVYGKTAGGFEAWVLVNPPAATSASALVVANNSTAYSEVLGCAYIQNIDAASPYRGFTINTGTGSVATITPVAESADLVLNIAGQLENNVATLVAPTVGGGQTSIGTDIWDANFGQRDASMGFGWQIGAAAATWTFNASRPWWALAIALRGQITAGQTTEPVGESGTGTGGTNADVYSPIDHVHEHGDLDIGGPYHDADQVTITDAGGIFIGTDVEAALQELGAAAVTDHGALTGLADDDHLQYRRTTGGGKDVISVVAASGASQTLDLTSGNVHDVTLTANCTLTLSGATSGVACSMAVLLRQDGTGSRTVTWPASVTWVGGSAPTLQTGANTWDWAYLVTLDGGTTWFAQHAGTSASTSSSSDTHVHIVDERISGDGATTTFGLSNTAEPETAIAYISGTRTAVTLGGTLNDEITFAVAPVAGTDNISVDYIAPAD